MSDHDTLVRQPGDALTSPPAPAPMPDDGARSLRAVPPASRLPVHAAAIGFTMLSLTIAGFVALVAALPRYTMSSTARRGLTYDTLFAELRDALIDEPDRPLRRAVHAVQVDGLVSTPTGVAAVTYDTLAVDAAGAYPSLGRGGFLRDEVERFNAYQRERLDAVRRGRAGGGVMLDLRAGENPSIFRTEVRDVADEARGDGDSVVLAERAVPYALRVPSPFDAARLVAVTTRQWSRSLAWISPRGATAVATTGHVPGEPPCPYHAVKDSVYVECIAPGSPFAQLALHFPDRLGETGTATLFTAERVLYDGARLPRRRAVPIGTGGMFQFRRAAAPARRARPEPVVLEWALAGTLGGTQWINGRIRWQPSAARTSPLVRQLAGAAGFAASVELEGGRNIPLSLDESLTDDLQASLDEFAAAADMPDLAFATVVLASARTGEILGVAEHGVAAPNGGSWLLEPVNVGSAVKPVLAAAALMRRPALATLEVRNDGPAMTDLWGIPLGKEFEAGSACPSGWIGLRAFLACSSNRYAAALVSAALAPDARRDSLVMDPAPGVTFRLGGVTHTGRRPHLPLDARRRVRADTLDASLLAAGLFALDSLPTSAELARVLGRDGRDSSVWMGLRDDRLTPVRAPVGLWPARSRLALAPANRSATVRQLAMFAVGAAENRLTTLDLTEAVARILTDRRVSVSFVPALGNGAPVPALGIARAPWYPALTGGLRDVGTIGTAKGTQDAMGRILGTSLTFFGKSGTLNAAPHVRVLRRADTTIVRGARVVRSLVFADTLVPPVVVKTLVFGVGGAAAPPQGALRCGMVGTVYFRLARNPAHVPSLATEFANERLWRVMRRHWQRLKLC